MPTSMRAHDWLRGLAVLFLISSTGSDRHSLLAISLPHSSPIVGGNLEQDATEKKFSSPAELIQNEQRHLRLVNPDVESAMGPSQHHPLPPFDVAVAGEHGLRGEFVPARRKTRKGKQRKDVKLQIRLRLGQHAIPALEYEVPRRWFDRPMNNPRRPPAVNARSPKKPALPKAVAPVVHVSPYEPWSVWTECMGICGSGIKERVRNCRPGSGSTCDHDSLRERQECSLLPCSKTEEMLVHPPLFGEWSSWSPCTATCGTAHRTQVRVCLKGKCDPELLRKKKDCGSLPSCSVKVSHAAAGKDETAPPTCSGPVEFFASSLPNNAYSSPLVKRPLPASAKWSSPEPFVFPVKGASSYKPTDETYLEIRFRSFRTVTGWKITGNAHKSALGVVSSYMVKVHDSARGLWRHIAGSNNVPRLYVTASEGDESRSGEAFTETISYVPHVDAIRFYPLQWTGIPFFKVDVKGCQEPPAAGRKPLIRKRPQKIVRHLPVTTPNPKPRRPAATATVAKPNPLACGQVPVSELKFHEIDYGKKVANLKNEPNLRGKGYVNLRLLAQKESTQNRNNHIALEVDLSRQREVQQLIFKGAIEEGLPAILRAFYLQFLDPQDKDWRWLSHAGKPTPFIVTQIPILNRQQVQTDFSVRFSQSLATSAFRIYPELWQKLPVIRMAVVACG